MTDAASQAAAPKTHYFARRAVFPQDRERILDLWRGNLGDEVRMQRKLSWFYERSPTGEPLAMLLCVSDTPGGRGPEPVGVAAAGRRPFQFGAEPLRAGVLVDLAVSPQHRTLFPALMLQKAVLKEGLAAGPLLYGFPNQKAAPVFQRAGYTKLATMRRYVRVLRAAHYLRRTMPPWAAATVGPAADWIARRRFGGRGGRDLRLEWLAPNEAVAGPAVATVGGQPIVRGARTDELLRWRFGAATGRKFEFVRAGAGGACFGYWVVEGVDNTLQVRDCSTALLEGAVAMRAWTMLFDDVRRRGFSSVCFECVAPPRAIATLERLGMVQRGERPVFGAVREDYPAAASASWYLTSADEDE